MSTTFERSRDCQVIADIDPNASDPDRRLRVALGALMHSGYVFAALTHEEVAALDPAFVARTREQLGLLSLASPDIPEQRPEELFVSEEETVRVAA